MATSLATQLAQLAAKSTNQLDLKAQREAHSRSLLFEPKVASSQDFDSLYEICYDGFQELCQLDPRFSIFSRTIFGPQSKTEDRAQMTAAQNEELDGVLESFLDLVAPKVLLKPALKAVEWVIRRFRLVYQVLLSAACLTSNRVHEFNTEHVLFTFLPYHSLPFFATLMSIIPSHRRMIPVFRWLQPYLESLTVPPRQALVSAAIRDLSFVEKWSSRVLECCRHGFQYQILISYWTSITSDAILGHLAQNTAGRMEAQKQKEDDILLRILPILNEGLGIRNSQDLKIGCYTLLMILTSAIDLQEKVLLAVMEAVVGTRSEKLTHPGIICLSVIAQRMHPPNLPKKAYRSLMNISTLDDDLEALSKQVDVGSLCLGITIGIIQRLEGNVSHIGFIIKVAEKKLLTGANLSAAVSMLLEIIADSSSKLTSDMRGRLADLLLRLGVSEVTGATVTATIEQSTVDISELESELQIKLLPANDQILLDVSVGDALGDDEGPHQTYESLKAAIPTKSAYETSFLSHSRSYVFDALYETFLTATKSTEHLRDFSNLPVIRKSLAFNEPLFLSFYTRVWSGPYPILVRRAAISSVRSFLQDSPLSIDLQALLPFMVYALADPANLIRREATKLMATWSHMIDTSKEKPAGQVVLGKDSIYGDASYNKDIMWLSTKDLSTVMNTIFLPNLEECQLDQNHISRIITRALKGQPNDGSSKPLKKELRTNVRIALLSFFASHIIHMPLFAVKKRLLGCLSQVGKVGSTSKSKSLLPLLRDFGSFDEKQLHDYCIREQLDISQLCQDVVDIVSPSDRDAVQVLQQIIMMQETSPSSVLRVAALYRLRNAWSLMKADSQITTLETLLTVANSSDMISGDALETIHSLTVPCEVFEHMLNNLPPIVPDTKLGSPASKRRRTSHGAVDGELNESLTTTMQSALREVTIVMEVLENSEQSHSSDIVRALFGIVGDIHNVKGKLGVDLSYLQALVFTCLRDSIEAAKKSNTNLDRHYMRADLIVDIFRTTANTQVQQAALLLMSSLASHAPDLIVHSVMPIFTFMGSSMLRQADNYSAHVIERTIDSVVPPLIESFRKDKRGKIAGATDLLLSFVAALDHMPVHRRLSLFTALINRLGADEYLFALLILLVDRYGDSKVPREFTMELCNRYGPVTQLTALRRYLDVVSDLLKAKPAGASVYLLPGDRKDKITLSVKLIQLPMQILKRQSLSSALEKSLSRNNEDANSIRGIYSELVKEVLGLSNYVYSSTHLQQNLNTLFDALLNLLSLQESIDSLEHFLDDGSESVKQQVLLSLDNRVANVKVGSSKSREACLRFLPRLQSILSNSQDLMLKKTALSCVDHIVDKFGKLSFDEMRLVAKEVSGSQCLGASETEIRMMSLICLTSLVEVLSDAIIPLIPAIVPLALSHLKETVEGENVDKELFIAAFTFFRSLFIYVPSMMLPEYLDKFILVSEISSCRELESDYNDARHAALELAARNTNPQDIFSSLRRTWSAAVSQGPKAIKEHLSILKTAVGKHSKSAVVKNSQLLMDLFLEMLDIRYLVHEDENSQYIEGDILSSEKILGEIMIQAIYKLNDTHFRPIFVKMVDWSNDIPGKRTNSRRSLRRTSLFGFLHTFFDTLKSIVTSYASLVLELTVDCLRNSSPTPPDRSLLWTRVVATLQAAFEHDQDDFWQAPSRFGPMAEAIIPQLKDARESESAAALNSCLTSFASAAGSSENLKTINAGVMKFLRDESADVRLAAVKCEISITEAIGEEWLSLLPEMLPFISEAMEDDDEIVETEVRRWVRNIETILGESLDSMLQ